MKGEIEKNLKNVFDHCQNDPISFLSTVGEYLKRNSNFFSGDFQTILTETFVNVANSSNFQNGDDNAQQSSQRASQQTPHNDTDNGNNKASETTQMNDDSRDMFADEEVIPETQYYADDDDRESGESITIPLFNRGKEKDSELTPTNENDTDDEPSEAQSQFLMAAVDRSMLEPLENSSSDHEDHSSPIARGTSPVQESTGTHKNYVHNEMHVVRSRSVTPDLDFADDPNPNKTNDNDAEELRGNTKQNHDDDETQMFSDNIFGASTQLINPNDLSTEDIFGASTQRVPANPNNLGTSTDVFGESTQIFVPPAPVAMKTPRPKKRAISSTVANDDDVLETSTDVFGESTQLFVPPASVAMKTPRTKRRAISPTVADDDDVFGANTQQIDLFDCPTQSIPIQNQSTAKKTVTFRKNINERSTQEQKPKGNDDSDDMFDAETEIILPSQNRQRQNQDLDETEIFDMPTQDIVGAKPKQKLFTAVAAKSSQPANTPEWSDAACIPTHGMEQRATKDADRKTQRLKKHRFLFADSDDDTDESEDDVEIDLPKTNSIERKKSFSIKEAIEKEVDIHNRLTQHTSKLVSSKNKENKNEKEKEKDNDKDQNKAVRAEKRKNSGEDPDETPAKMPAQIHARRVSVKMSRLEVTNYFKEEKEKKTSSKKNRAVTESKSNKVAERKANNVAESKPSKVETSRQRSMRERKSESPNVNTVESRQNMRTKQVDKELSREKRGKESTKPGKQSPKPKLTSKSMKNSRKKEADSKTSTSKKDLTVASNPVFDSSRRRSDRSSARKSTKFTLLFTKLNSAPYAKSIEKLGGCIVDTPELGGILICDKISRTFKFLYALSKGLPVVTSHWLDMSIEYGGFLSPHSYLVSDKAAEKRFNFNFKKSLESARRTPLFADYHVFATPSAQPAPIEINDIVECAGGKYAADASVKSVPNRKAVLITDKKDRHLWKEYQNYHPNIRIVSSEGFMQSVVQQKIRFSDFTLASAP